MGHWFQTHRRHCIVSLSQTLHSLLSTDLTQEDMKMSGWPSPNMIEKIVDWDLKHQHKLLKQQSLGPVFTISLNFSLTWAISVMAETFNLLFIFKRLIALYLREESVFLQHLYSCRILIEAKNYSQTCCCGHLY